MQYIHDPYYPQPQNNPKTTPKTGSSYWKVASSGIDMRRYPVSPILPPIEEDPLVPSGLCSLDSMLQYNRADSLDSADMILEDKMKLLGTKVRHLVSEVQSRNRIKEKHLEKIEDEIMKCESYLDNLDQVWGLFENPLVESKRQALGREISNLEEQKREQVVKAWSDQARLAADLLEAMGEYRAAIRRNQVLQGN